MRERDIRAARLVRAVFYDTLLENRAKHIPLRIETLLSTATGRTQTLKLFALPDTAGRTNVAGATELVAGPATTTRTWYDI